MLLRALGSSQALARGHRAYVLSSTALALVAALAADVYLHEAPAHLRRCLVRRLRGSSSDDSQWLGSVPAAPLPVSQAPLALGFAPTLLLGPDGCGKTGLLSSTAAALASGTPVLLVRVRLSGSMGEVEEKVEGQAGRHALRLLQHASHQVFSQIGFPLRRSLLGWLLEERCLPEAQAWQAASRLVGAPRLLCEACEQLSQERQLGGLPPLEAAPVLLLDGVEDFVYDARLRRAGGQAVVHALGALLTRYSLERTAVRAALAGTPTELPPALGRHSARWHSYDLQDPQPSATAAALAARGYSAEEVSSMLRLCGPRLRLLQGPLTDGAVPSAAGFERRAQSMASTAYAGIFARLGSAEEAAQLACLLDRVEACQAAAALAGAPLPAAQQQLQWPARHMLPAALARVDVAPILSVDRQGRLTFQSQLHRRVWAQKRSEWSP